MVNWTLKKAETSFHTKRAEVCPIFLILLKDTPMHASRDNLVSAVLYFIYYCVNTSFPTLRNQGCVRSLKRDTAWSSALF